LKRAETEAAAKTAAAAAPAAGAGTTAETPKPPPPMNELAKKFLEVEKPRKLEEVNRMPNIDKQWTESKDLAIEVLGGVDKVVKLTDDIFQNSIQGISLPADKIRLRRIITDKLLERNIQGFEYKDGSLLGTTTVTVPDIAAALVDDIIRSRESGVAEAVNATAAPTARQAPDMQSGILKPPSR
jgi:hypothetical protein